MYEATHRAFALAAVRALDLFETETDAVVRQSHWRALADTVDSGQDLAGDRSAADPVRSAWLRAGALLNMAAVIHEVGGRADPQRILDRVRDELAEVLSGVGQ